ncbi:MAG TPA: radical SAM protein, partial [Chthoniobacterales bacterium]|nr:radical SAM protein [Chthoniobacterales bacterium]
MFNDTVAFAGQSGNGCKYADGSELSDPDLFWDREAIIRWLQVRGTEQELLFAAARSAREQVYGRRVIVRGLIEVTNLCRVNCEFCPMRRDNTKQNTIFQLTPDQILDVVSDIKAAGINIVFFQAGEVGKTTRLVGDLLPEVQGRFDSPVELLLCLGNKTDTEYEFLKKQGGTSYILKHETSDPDLNERMRQSSFEERIRCLRTLVRLGFKVGTGAIVGLPGQSIESLADDLELARDLGAHMVSGSPFIPAPDTPLAGHPPGDVELTLNLIAIARIMNPSWLIPSVSALERRQGGGQLSGLAAGANVLT